MTTIEQLENGEDRDQNKIELHCMPSKAQWAHEDISRGLGEDIAVHGWDQLLEHDDDIPTNGGATLLSRLGKSVRCIKIFN